MYYTILLIIQAVPCRGCSCWGRKPGVWSNEATNNKHCHVKKCKNSDIFAMLSAFRKKNLYFHWSQIIQLHYCQSVTTAHGSVYKQSEIIVSTRISPWENIFLNAHFWRKDRQLTSTTMRNAFLVDALASDALRQPADAWAVLSVLRTWAQ